MSGVSPLPMIGACQEIGTETRKPGLPIRREECTMVSRSIVSRFVTRHREDLLSRVAPEQTEGDPAGTEHDPGASRRALLRQLGALGIAAVGGTALGSEAAGAKGQHAAKRSKRQKSQKQKGRREGSAPEETEA